MLNSSPLPVSPDLARETPATGPLDWSAVETFRSCARRFRLAHLDDAQVAELEQLVERLRDRKRGGKS